MIQWIVYAFNLEGEEKKKMVRPFSAALVVAFVACPSATDALDRGTEVAYKADPTWQPKVPFPLPSLGAMASCAVGFDGSTFVGSRVKSVADLPSVLVLDGTGQYVRGFGNGTMKSVHGMRMQHGSGGMDTLWVTDSAASAVLKFDPANGKLLSTMGSKGTGVDPLQFGSVADVSFSSKGDVFISDGDGGINARVIKLNSAMQVQWINGNNGTVTPAEVFASPHSLDYDDASGTVSHAFSVCLLDTLCLHSVTHRVQNP